MSEPPFFVAGLQPGDILNIEQFDSSDPLPIKVVSGVVARGGSAHILKGEVQPCEPLANPALLVAIKVILTLTANNTDRERIRRELAALKHVRHRYILPSIGSLSTDLYTVIVSHFMENGNLLQHLRKNATAKPGPLLLQVAIAVDHLHRHDGLVHGDLKCENILISHDGDVQLVDFGYSTSVEKPPDEDPTATAIRISNTVHFAAPEVLLDEAKSPSGRTRSKTAQADVYAFGMLILQAFTGARPWQELTAQAVVLKVTKGTTPPRPANDKAAGLSDAWWELCCNCWKFNPEKRPTMLEVVGRIRAISGIAELGEAAVAKPSETPTGPSFFWRMWPWSK